MSPVVQAGDSPLGEDRYIYMDFWHGEARDIRLVNAEEGTRAKFVITGGYERWKQVVKGELEPSKGMMQGKLRLLQPGLRGALRGRGQGAGGLSRRELPVRQHHRFDGRQGFLHHPPQRVRRLIEAEGVGNQG